MAVAEDAGVACPYAGGLRESSVRKDQIGQRG